VTSDTAIIWSRTNKPSRMLVEYATTDSFSNARRVQGPAARAVSDFTARIELTDLPAGQEIFYRVLIQDLADPKILSAPTLGHFRTAPAQRRPAILRHGQNQWQRRSNDRLPAQSAWGEAV
jgi:alkaline phosphatase D